MSSSDAVSADRDDDIDFIALWRIVWDRRYFIILFTALCGCVAVVLALTATLIFRAEVVVVEASSDGLSGGASLANQLGGLASLVGVNIGSASGEGRESLALLKSRRLVEEFVKRYDLRSELMSRSKQPPTLWRAVQRFRQGVLSIRDDKRSGTTTVIIQWTDPAIAARWANDFVALANELRRHQVVEDSKRNIVYLNQQITQTNVVELRRVMYNLIAGETKKLMLANARDDYAFAIVDPAVAPEIRISPKRTIMVLIGGMLGVIGGIILALAHAKWRKYKHNADAERIA